MKYAQWLCEVNEMAEYQKVDLTTGETVDYASVPFKDIPLLNRAEIRRLVNNAWNCD